MKKALVILIVLVLLGGAVFYFGWVQLRLPGDACALIFTRTGGFDREVTLPGSFHWRWERLIPGNLTLYRYSLAPHRTRVDVRQELPSAQLYAAVLPEKPDFSVQAAVELEFALRPQSIPALLRDRRLYPEALPEFYRAEAEALGAALTEVARRALEGASDLAGAPDLAALQAAARGAVAERFPHLDILGLELRELRLPDPALYELARASYRSLVATRDRARDEAERALAPQRAGDLLARERESSSLQSLSAYGELLNKYPVLLKAMYVQNLSGRELATVPGFDLDRVLSGLEPR